MMRREILEDWEVPYFRKMIFLNKKRYYVLDENKWTKDKFKDSVISYYRNGMFRNVPGYNEQGELEGVYKAYIAARAKRNAEFALWILDEVIRHSYINDSNKTSEMHEIKLSQDAIDGLQSLSRRCKMSGSELISFIVEAVAIKYKNKGNSIR